MPDRPAITVRCEPDGDDWRCNVTVGADAAATRHEVLVGAEDLLRFAPSETTVDVVVTASFEFLLEREPREAILRNFELSVISRYFPDYEREIRRRLAN